MREVARTLVTVSALGVVAFACSFSGSGQGGTPSFFEGGLPDGNPNTGSSSGPNTGSSSGSSSGAPNGSSSGSSSSSSGSSSGMAGYGTSCTTPGMSDPVCSKATPPFTDCGPIQGSALECSAPCTYDFDAGQGGPVLDTTDCPQPPTTGNCLPEGICE